MKRREFLLASAASLISAPAIGKQKPNIVVMIADDLRADMLGVAGNNTVRTSSIDRLARSSVNYRDAFVTTPVCAPSRASIMLGQYSSTHGDVDFERALSTTQWENSYHGRLKASGYKVGYVGKWGLGGASPTGFDFYDGFQGAGRYHQPGRKHLTEYIADQSISFIKNRTSPYCLTVGFWAPHAESGADPVPAETRFKDIYRNSEFPKPPSFSWQYNSDLPKNLTEPHAEQLFASQIGTPERYRNFLIGYLGLISGMDASIARILANVDLENTVVVFLSDNGFFLGEHGRPGKWLAHEESIRVPIIISAPGAEKASQKMALNIDIAPTVLGSVGLDHETCDGINLLDAQASRDEFFTSIL